MSRPVRITGASLVSRVRPEDGPAGDMKVDILLVLIVPQKNLGVFPAVEPADLDVRVGCAGSYGLQRFTLAVTPVRPLNMSGLDLAAVMDDDAVFVDERLRETSAPSELVNGDTGTCLGDI